MITVYTEKNEKGQTTVCLPAVFKAPIRPDIVSFIHHEVAKNKRQPYCVNVDAGHQTSAESWGRLPFHVHQKKGWLKKPYGHIYLKWVDLIWINGVL